MSWLRALLLSVGCLLLAVGSSFASPPPQPPVCQISGFLAGLPIPYVFYVREEAFLLDGHQLTLHICAPQNHSLTGDQALEQLKIALPRLNELAGTSLNGSYMRPLVIEPEDKGLFNIDGLFKNVDAIYIPSTSPERMIVHGGAHYWANSHNFAEPWMIEGYAEYLTERVTDLPRPYVDTQPCDGKALMEWNHQQRHSITCEYVVGAAVFRDLAAAIGPETLRNVLNEAQRTYGPISSWQLMVLAERASSSNLSHLFRGRVFPATWNERLDERDALHSRIEQAELLLKQQGLTAPPSLSASFISGDLDGTRQWLDTLMPVLENSGAIMGDCARLKLECNQYWNPLPDTIAGLRSLREQLNKSHTLLGQYTALRTSAQNSGIEPTSLHQQIGSLDPQLLTEVQQSIDTLHVGRAISQRCEGLQVVCTQWQQPWAEHKLDDAQQQINKVKEMLDRVPALERTCAAKGWPCGQSWRNAFKRTNNSEETMVVMNQIEGKLDELSALTKLITEEPNNRMPLLGTIVSNRLNDAQLAFADGDVERALALAHEARRMQERGYWLPYALLAIVVLAVLVIGWVLIRRRHTPNKPGPTSTSNG
jgi:hypothetical protein